MSENIQYCRNMQHVLTRVIKSVLVDDSVYIYFNMIRHNGMNSTKTIISQFNPVHGFHTRILFLRL